MDDRKRQDLFEQLKALLQEYGDVLEIDSDPGKYSLSTTKPIEVDGENHEHGYYFAGLRAQKNVVAFYYEPIHVWPDLKEAIPESVQAIQKGDTTFNVKVLTPELQRDLRKMMDLGVQTYKDLGWI